jgi:hypothetical protein
MALSPFLENLKKSVDTGEFNSDAAKKIIEVNKLADNPLFSGALSSAYEKATANKEIKTVTEAEAATIKEDFDKMQVIKEKDLALQQLAMLRDIEETVRLSVYDMRDFLKTLDETFDKNNPNFAELLAEVELIKNKYSSIINN